jgi:predicted MFS family arabinose efflux permease
VLSPYRDLLSTPGGLRFSAAGFVARMPIAMMSLGIVLLVAGRTGRYGVAGAVSAAFALVNAVSAPLIAQLIDRVGQRRVLLPAVALHAVSLVAFIVLVTAKAPTWTWFAGAATAGLFAPSIGSLVRARWGYVLGPGRLLQTAFSFEAVVDEFIFFVGPLLVTVLATQVNPQAGLIAALALLVVGTALLVAHRASEPPAAPAHEHGRGSALRVPGMPLLLVVMFFIGGVFGGVEISAVAFADQKGHPELAGPLLASYAAGSMLAGLAFGAIHWKVPLTRRFLLGAVVMTATVAVLPFIDHPGVLAVALFVAGLGIAPTLISGLSLVERMVPAAKMTEGLTWATTGVVVGLSVASPVAGRIVDEVGAQRAFVVGLVSGASAVVVCALGYRRLHEGSATP